MKTNSNKKTTRTVIIIVLLIVAVAGYYCYLVNRPTEGTEEKELTAVDEVLLRNLINDYPPTVKEVVKYYNEITKCIYNEEYTQEELESMIQKQRELFDEDLLEANEWGSHVISLGAEVLAFEESGRKLTGCKVGASTDVDYFEQDGYSFARIPCSYTVMQGTDSTTTMHIFLLRRDADGHWKIYGWDLADNVDYGSETQAESQSQS